jgi:deoxyribodipyrimidine photolyase-related protein
MDFTGLPRQTNRAKIISKPIAECQGEKLGTGHDMMKKATVIFPHQLFEHHPALSKELEIYLVEEPLFFSGVHSSLKFHKKKLMLHRASMKAYQKKLESRGYRVHYVDFKNDLFQSLRQKKIEEIWFSDPGDRWLESKLKRETLKSGMAIRRYPTPGFLTPEDWLFSFFKESKHLSMTPFYIAQRKRLNVLVKGDKPIGGKWSFDPENRKRIPKGLSIPHRSFPSPSPHVKEAKTFVEKNFSEHPGTTEDFIYPVTHRDAEKWLDDFLKKGLKDFGDYEDAMMRDEPFLFHSLLTPSLNIGLLTPDQVVERTLAFAKDHRVPLKALEGFIRQIIGWREFIRAVYLLKQDQERKTNFFKHTRRLPSSFYTGTTGLDPVDIVIKRLGQYAYAHHIERLMVLGNAMLLCEIDPTEVYRWFMEMFIDAYDWVMVPNVYGMSQHADGGLITTKPYISSSHYIRKMSDFPEGDWCEIWDGLYWRFIHKHRDFFNKNPRMKVMTNQLDRMGKARLSAHLTVANRFLDSL